MFLFSTVIVGTFYVTYKDISSNVITWLKRGSKISSKFFTTIIDIKNK